jgi:glycerophosphoryl diester phosphodiesterase
VTAIETDIHLTRDGVPVLSHDPIVSGKLCRLRPGIRGAAPSTRLLVSSLTHEQLQAYRADQNPDPSRFPAQDPCVTPLAQLYAERRGTDPYAIPTLAELFDFTQSYSDQMGRLAGKTDSQQKKAIQVRFDLELKRVPFWPMVIGDNFDAESPGLLERRVVETIREAGVLARTVVRSFDHRSVRSIRLLEPRLTTAVLIAETAPVTPALLVRQADAEIYCPDFRFLDYVQVRLVQAEGIRIIPYTANEPEEWLRLLEWEVDGITTDFPNRLALLLNERGIAF